MDIRGKLEQSSKFYFKLKNEYNFIELKYLPINKEANFLAE